jgi:flagellar basal body L-ring protein FlgH
MKPYLHRWPFRAALAALLAAGFCAFAAPASAQDADPGAGDGTEEAAPDTVAAPVVAPRMRAPRASWLSDRMPLRAGDLVTVVVDEQTVARENVRNESVGNRSQRADLNAGIGTDAAVGPAKSFGTGVQSSSRENGDAGRNSGFTTVLTVQVVSVEPNGVAKIQGTKKVTLDGRAQDVTLTGSIRAEDVDALNRVRSDAIADAQLTWKGKKIAPKTGILGSILGILWP